MLAMRSRLFGVLFVLLLVLTTASRALFAEQTFRLQTVRVIGSHRFREEELVATLGLKRGDTVSVETLQKAADRLMATGVLASLEYKYTPLSTGLLVEYTATDGADFLSCRYDNIVWMNSEDLTKAVHEKVPLYNGEAPSSGELLDQIKQAISDVLAQQGIATSVRYELHAQGVGGPIDGVSFVSDTVRPKVQEILLTGAPLLTPQERVESTKRLIGDEYSATNLHDSLLRSLFFVYGNKGYLRMRVGEPAAKIVGDPKQAMVSVTVAVEEGPQYRWKGITWTGNSTISTGDLDKAVPLRAGEIADHSKLDLGLSGVQRAYKSKGYIGMKLQRTPSFDDQDHTVSYEVKVTEGDQFRMGALHIMGVDAAVADKLQKNWKMARGDAYNDEYLQTFLKENAALITGSGRAKTLKTLQSPTPDKMVDVTLQF